MCEEKLLEENRRLRDKEIKKIKTEFDAVEFQMVQLKNFIYYLQEMNDKGSHNDIVCSGKELVSRTEHILSVSKDLSSKQHVDIIRPTYFVSSIEDIKDKIIGRYETKGKHSQ